MTLMGFLLRLAVFVVAVAYLSVPGEVVSAQGVADELKDQWLGVACRDNPDSEVCICAPVAAQTAVPIGEITYSAPPPGSGEVSVPLTAANVGGSPTDVPSFDLEERRWDGEPEDLQVVENTWFKRHCALAFFREDLTRAWYFAVALGASFLSLSFVFAGVVYMQESAAGADLAASRSRIYRIIIGMIILGMAYVLYEGTVTVIFNATDAWSGDRAIFYEALDRGD